jgi:hypothetical protein
LASGCRLTIVGDARKWTRRALEFGTKKEHCSLYVLDREVGMLRIFVEEAAALTSIALFVGMIAVWAQLLTAF